MADERMVRMRRELLTIAVLTALAPSTRAQLADSDGDGIPDEVELRLGCDPKRADAFTRVFDDKSKADGDQHVGSELEVAHDLTAVALASVGRRRWVWRLDFTEPWTERGDVALIIYIDADNDPDTGRTKAGVRGTDLMLRPEGVHQFGVRAGVRSVSAAHAKALYLTLDGELNVADGQAACRAYVLIQNRRNLSDTDRTPWFDVRVPAIDDAPIAAEPGHPLYRAPEKIERVRVRVPIDGGGRTAVVTWITSWPTGSVLQYGTGQRYEHNASNPERNQNHRIELTGLQPGATYDLRICAQGEDDTPPLLSTQRFDTTVNEPRGQVQRQLVALQINGVLGPRQPVCSGVPFPRGALGSGDRVRVLDAAGAEVPAQVAVSSRWPDRSVKWILLDFAADIPDSGETRYSLEFGYDVTRADVAAPIRFKETDAAVTVDTGVLNVRLDRRRFSLLGEVWLDANRDGVYADAERVTDTRGAGIVLTALDGEQFTSAGEPEVLEVVRRGPLHLVVRVRGHHRSEAGGALFVYELYLHFYAGSPLVRIHHTFENDVVAELFTTVRCLELRLPLATELTGSRLLLPGGGVAVPAGSSARLVQTDDQLCRLEGVSADAEPSVRAPGVVSANGSPLGLTTAVRDFWQLYPKSVETDSRGAVIGIMPRLRNDEYANIDPNLEDKLYYYLLGGVYKLHRGVSKTHELLVEFHDGTPSAGRLRALAAVSERPPLALASPLWYAESKAFWHISPRVSGEFDEYERMVERILSSLLDVREREREYGMLNFGDWWGERGYNWGNIEYDTQHGLFMQFARTGDRRYFDNAVWAARHNIDVDMIHHAPAGQAVGVPYYHCHCHTGDYYASGHRPSGIFRGSWNSGHLWTRGNLEYALLTGDLRGMRVALRTADWLAGPMMLDYHMSKGAERATAWPLFGLMAAYQITADEYYLNAAEIITEEVIAEQNPDTGHWDIPAGYSKALPRPVGGYAWCAGLLLTSLEMANESLRKPELDRTFSQAAEWLARDEWLPERKGFRACSCETMNASVTPGFECYRTPAAMLHAYELSGDRKFLDIAHVGFSYAARRGGSGGKGGSTALTLTPHAVYKLKQAGITSLDTAQWESGIRLQAPGWVSVEPGRDVAVPVTAINNRDQKFAVTVRVTDTPKAWAAIPPVQLVIQPRATATVRVELPHAADVEPGSSVAVVLVIEAEGQDEPLLRRTVLLSAAAEGGLAGGIGLVAGSGDFLGPALRQAGVSFVPVAGLGELRSFSTVFLGTQAHALNAAGVQTGSASLLTWVQQGGTLVLSQLNDDGWRPEFLPGTVVLGEENDESGATVAAEHAIFSRPAAASDVAGMRMFDTITQADGWRVLLADAAGRPAIIETAVGAGRILAFMPSVERYYTGELPCADRQRLAAYRQLFDNIIAWALSPGSEDQGE